MNRLDDIVFYKPLSKTEISSIVDLILNALKERLSDKQLNLDISEKAKQYIIDSGYDPIYGARPLKRFIQSKVETLVGRMIISNDPKPDSTIYIDYNGTDLTAENA